MINCVESVTQGSKSFPKNWKLSQYYRCQKGVNDIQAKIFTANVLGYRD